MRLRLKALDLEVRLDRQPFDATKDVRHVLLLREDRLEILEAVLQVGDLRLEFGQPPGRGHAAGDIRAKRRQPLLTSLDVGLLIDHVKLPEAKHRARRHQDEGAYLAVPRKFAECQFHCVLRLIGPDRLSL